MYCQKCRQPLRLDGSLEELNPAAYDLLISSSSPSSPPMSKPSHQPRSSAVPPQDHARRALYEKASRNAGPPSFKRHSGGQPRDSAMSFIYLTESQVGQSQQLNKEPPTMPSPRLRPSGSSMVKRTSDADEMERMNRLFEVLSARSDIDHPICVECTEVLVDGLQTKLDMAAKERDAYVRHLRQARAEQPTQEDIKAQQEALSKADKDRRAAMEELLRLEKDKSALDEEILALEEESRQLDKEEESFWRERNEFATNMAEFQAERDSVNAKYSNDSQLLDKLQRSNVYNDTFCISHDGSFATINGLRLGRLSSKPVDWPEINAAWGHALLLLVTVAEKLSYRFQGYDPQPMGSTSKIVRHEVSSPASSRLGSRITQPPPKKQVLELYSSGDMPLGLTFMHRKFDNAMVAFLELVRQLGVHVQEQTEPSGNPLSLPYRIEGDKIGDVSIKLGIAQDDGWTKACKLTLTCCKFLLAHASNVSSGTRNAPSGSWHVVAFVELVSREQSGGMEPQTTADDRFSQTREQCARRKFREAGTTLAWPVPSLARYPAALTGSVSNVPTDLGVSLGAEKQHADDVGSIDSFGVSTASSSESTWTSLAGPDGRFPDIVYTLKRYDRDDRLVDTLVRDAPFDDADLHGSPRDSDSEQKSVLQIVTRAFQNVPRGSRSYHRLAPLPPPPPPPPPRGAVYPYDVCGLDNEDDVEHNDDETHSQTMIIHSEHLINALQAVVGYDPDLVFGTPFSVPAPYRSLFYHRRELVDYRDKQPSTHNSEQIATTARHIDVLLSFLERHLGEEVRREETLHRLDRPLATFDLFWLLLKPGSVVYAKRFSVWTAYVVSGVTMPRCQSDGYSVMAWLLEFDGSRLQRLDEVHNVPRWRGEHPVAGLPIIPAALWPEDWEAQGGRSMRDKQTDDGKLYWELLQRPTYMQYEGMLLKAWPSEEEEESQTGFMKGRVICDGAGFDRFGVEDRSPTRGWTTPHTPLPPHPPPPMPPRMFPLRMGRHRLPQNAPRCGCRACGQERPRSDIRSPFYGFEDLDPVSDRTPEQNVNFFFLVCSKVIPGFVLGTRRWATLHVAKLRPLQPDKDAFGQLVIDEDTKRTVKALVGQFTSSRDRVEPWAGDFVRNKGEGRILLLHGQPGVGKTCTAECMAELTNRPLLSLTSGDLGLSATEQLVESRLNYFLGLGQRYGALVLLDEADVYLEKRRPCDVSRNGLVALFLRALEYYRGVLILTTNRVRSFDRAFLSRIHVALHYGDLTDDHRRLIWSNACDRLERLSRGRVRVSDAVRSAVGLLPDANGREIRNALQTALALAEDDASSSELDGVTVRLSHLAPVVELARAFGDFASSLE
ncbi:hypothetical protein CP533_3889 [Ophiocordyceps camponoti-saundersi (nom. inval.)]|nr:hypothetical protein CP533_3889 [Ophiocordyceps camponoti-saundersi (nom. inval.)]